MDAKHLAVPDASFDVVVAQYVITAVPDPEATLDEFVRVLKPGGEIILVNHLGAESGFRRAFEQGFSPIARRLGWSPEFPWERLTRWAEARRRPPDRAPADAAARAFLADPVRQTIRQEPDRVPARSPSEITREASMKFHVAIVTAALLATVPALAQTNGASPRDSKACAPGAASNLKMPADTPTPQAPKMPNETTGSGGNLSDKLAPATACCARRTSIPTSRRRRRTSARCR